jgi:GMP synthase (glutamine-hydrolysing)
MWPTGTADPAAAMIPTDMPARERKKVLAVQHVAVEPPALVADALQGEGVGVDVVHTYRGEPVPGDAAGLDGLVVMGGPMAVYEADRLPHLRQELKLIDSSLRRGLPVLGVCLGSQLLAAALGARVEKGTAKEIGWYPVALEPAAREDPLLGQLPGSFEALHWHGDVFELPRGAVRLARSERTATQAFRHGKAWGLLFHAEVTARQVADMAAAFEDELEDAGVTSDALLHGARAHLAGLERLARPLFRRWAAQL